MAPHRLFANYPLPKESTDVTYKYEEDKNPVLRGLPLAIGSSVISNLGFVQKILWKNAGFGNFRSGAGLEDVPWTIHPIVIPLADESSPASMLDISSSALTTQQPADRPGRFHSAADFTARFLSRELTPLQVVEALLPLVQREPTDGSAPSKYSPAFVANDVDRILAAAKASTQRYGQGKPLGPLDGVPIGVKCDTDLEGYVSTFGMKPNKNYPFFRKVQEKSAWPVQKLQDAGAVVIGHQLMHEIGMDTTGCNPEMGTPMNWYNKSYFPGGSSTGAGSSMGAGLVPISVGTDGGGSIRIPSTYNGLYGLKPSHNRTMSCSCSTVVVGPLAATVSDLTIAYRVMSQPDPSDSVQNKFAISSLPTPGGDKVIGVAWNWVDKADPIIIENFKKTVDYFEKQAGYRIIDIGLPLLREGQLAHAATCVTEAFATARSRTPDPDDWKALLNYPNRMLLSTAQHTPASEYMRYGQIKTVIMQHLAHLWQEHPGLLVLSPTTPAAGWKVHPGDQAYGLCDGNMTVRNMMFVWLANLTGCPALSAPMGYAEPEQGVGRVPMGIMAMGEWGAEEQLLGWAGDAERYINEAYPGGRVRPEEWVDVVALAKEKAQGNESTMVYEWEAHKETCYRLYIEEKKSLEDIIEYMRVQHNFKPSKRAFQTQFRKWDFPHKKNPAHKNDQLVARVHELWGRSLPQREMLRILNEEDGFDIKPRELMRLRSRNRWLLRAPNPASSAVAGRSSTASSLDDVGMGDSMLGMQHQQQQQQQLYATDAQIAREERRRRLETESAERWASKKRRRRTRAWAGMPPDPEGLPPRFPSETTLDESRAVLDLNRDQYQRLRARFREICAEDGIERKTVAGPNRWEQAKDRLVAESAHLQAVMWTAEGGSEEAKKLALDVLCTDVTKRMRAGEPRMTIAKAKNILGVNPEETRAVRGALYDLLREDGFLSKLEDGTERWDDLKGQWLEESDILQGKLAACEDETDADQKRKAIDAIAKDVVKRFRDDQTRRNPARKGMPAPTLNATPRQDAPVHIEITPADMAALANTPLDPDGSYVSHLSPLAMVPGTPDSHAHSPGSIVPMPMQAPSPQQQHHHHLQGPSPHLHHQRLLPPQATGAVIDPQTGLPMDPSALLLPPDVATSPAAYHHHHHHGNPFAAAQFGAPPAFHQQQQQQQRRVSTASSAVGATPVYLRLHPDSGVAGDPASPWIAMLVNVPSLDEVRHVAAGKYPGSVCTAVEAVLKTPQGTGGGGGSGGGGMAEVPLLVGSDVELEAYLTSPLLEGSAPMFNVRLDYEYESVALG